VHADSRRTGTGGRPRSGTMPAFIDLPARNFPPYKFPHPWEHVAEAVRERRKMPLRPRSAARAAAAWRSVRENLAASVSRSAHLAPVLSIIPVIGNPTRSTRPIHICGQCSTFASTRANATFIRSPTARTEGGRSSARARLIRSVIGRHALAKLCILAIWESRSSGRWVP
jgi:hypothetical protein